MSEPRTKCWYINNIRLFNGLGKDEMDRLMPMIKEFRVGRKDFIYTTGDPSDTIYILKEGTVKITRFSEAGRELTVDILGPGDIFGELALAVVDDDDDGGDDEQGELDTTAQALEDCYVCTMRRCDFNEFIKTMPHLSLHIMKLMGTRMKRIENRLENMIFQDVHTRLYGVLKDLSIRYGSPSGDCVRLTLRLTHQELASLIGASRETVTTELNNLKKTGAINIDGKEITICA